MQKLKLFLIFTTVILSLLVLLVQPKMHKQAVITDYQYAFIEEEAEVNKNINITPKSNPNVNIGVSPQKSLVKKTIQQPKKTVAKPQSKTKVASNPNTTVEKEPVLKSSRKPVKTEPVEVTLSNNEPETPKQEIKHELTEQEEIIVWNRWRSRLQNQVMLDTKIAAPYGTAFKFSFTVDKFGNMSNVKVWSTNPSYSDLAVRAIKPVLMSYQHKPILNFPEGTKRIITNVVGGFVIAHTTEYSKPSDYSDYERVTR